MVVYRPVVLKRFIKQIYLRVGFVTVTHLSSQSISKIIKFRRDICSQKYERNINFNFKKIIHTCTYPGMHIWLS